MKSAVMLTTLLMLAEEGARKLGYANFDEAYEDLEKNGVFKDRPADPVLPPFPVVVPKGPQVQTVRAVKTLPDGTVVDGEQEIA